MTIRFAARRCQQVLKFLWNGASALQDFTCSNTKHVLKRIMQWLLLFRICAWSYNRFQICLIDAISVGPVPEHVSFIMDGNRRYAKALNMPIKKGHEAGGITLLQLVYACKKMGIRCVSAYAFSIENFNRSEEEINTLMGLFADKLDEFAKRAKDYRDPLYGSHLKIIGDQALISKEMQQRIARVQELTMDGDDDFTLFICFPYTSRNDIAHSISQCANKELMPGELSVKELTNAMYLENYSNKCDLLIRTSGHNRFSDYMLWQAHNNNCKIHFTPHLWPDFNFILLYILVLNWSFETTWTKYTTKISSIRHGIHDRNPLKRRHRRIRTLDMLPNPPQSISITGETD